MAAIGLVFNGLSICLGSSAFILGIIYLFGVVGVLEENFLSLKCDLHSYEDAQSKNKYRHNDGGAIRRTPHNQEIPYFKTTWQCNYFKLEQAAGSLAIVAGLVQVFVCVLALATVAIKWRIWIIVHLAIAVAYIVIIACVLQVVNTTQDRALKDENNGTTFFWESSSPHLGVTDAEHTIIRSLILLFTILILINLLYCVFSIFIVASKRHKIQHRDEPQPARNEHSAVNNVQHDRSKETESVEAAETETTNTSAGEDELSDEDTTEDNAEFVEEGGVSLNKRKKKYKKGKRKKKFRKKTPTTSSQSSKRSKKSKTRKKKKPVGKFKF